MADSRLRDRLGRFGARLGGSAFTAGAGGFFGWWSRSLLSWLPMRMRVALGMDRGRLLLQREGDSVHLRLQRLGEVRDLGHLPGLADTLGTGTPNADPLAGLLAPAATKLPRWLVLPAASGLRRRLLLPAAAADRLRDVVGFEIERQTPFAADAVAFDARVLGRRESDGQIEAELVVVPRTTLDPHLTALGPLASTLAGADVAAADGVPLGINLLPPALRTTTADPWRVWNLAFAALALLATAALLWQLLDNRRDAADRLEAQIEQRAAPARRAAAERAELVALLEGQAFLDRLRATRPTDVEIIEEVSRRLPDGTYLEKIAIEDDRLTLIGLSNEAAALVSRLQGSPLWRSPALAGALMPDPSSGRDRFTLTAELTPEAAKTTPEAARGNR
ncbi:PilN domain-containing protein [Lysobacter korlensis]|uniref:PilN domain-containing protein n=1 Tax=Lysobacter korlensis TaxID=553636 RepID=A0ABV6RLX6_9GAMM